MYTDGVGAGKERKGRILSQEGQKREHYWLSECRGLTDGLWFEKETKRIPGLAGTHSDQPS